MNAIADSLIYSFSDEFIIALGALFALFILFITLSIGLNHKKVLSLIFISLALATVSAGPLVAYDYVNRVYKSVEYKQIELRQLQFKDEALLKGFVVNRSQKNLKDCKIEGKLFLKTDSKFQRFLKLMSPKSKDSAFLEGSIAPNSVRQFTLEFPNIAYEDELEISLKTVCR